MSNNETNSTLEKKVRKLEGIVEDKNRQISELGHSLRQLEEALSQSSFRTAATDLKRSEVDAFNLAANRSYYIVVRTN